MGVTGAQLSRRELQYKVFTKANTQNTKYYINMNTKIKKYKLDKVKSSEEKSVTDRLN